MRKVLFSCSLLSLLILWGCSTETPSIRQNSLSPMSFADDEDFRDYVNAKIERSTFKSEIQIKPDDQIVTLSTCSYHANDGRFALFCKSTEIDVEQALVM